LFLACTRFELDRFGERALVAARRQDHFFSGILGRHVGALSSLRTNDARPEPSL
jgi:hypothetical protein